MPRRRVDPGNFTEREIEVLRRASEGMTNREIADSLQLSTDSIKRILRGIYEKLGVRRRPKPPDSSIA
jgi:DNA-binding CsgD family transcriptional regulator